MSKSQEIQWLLKEKYGDIVSAEAERDIERIKQGEPVAYIIGFVDFLGCKIDLSQRTLIPRPETEFWVEQAIADVKHSVLDKIKCLDMFAGSGCIGVAVLKNVPESIVDFADLNESAIKQIEINCKLNNIDQSRYNIIKSDMFKNIGKTYDYIFANPPYIAENNKDEVQESILKHEPHSALFAGEDGLKYVEPFLHEAEKYLNPGGKIYMESGEDQKDAIEEIIKNVNFFQDQFGKWRYSVLSK